MLDAFLYLKKIKKARFQQNNNNLTKITEIIFSKI